MWSHANWEDQAVAHLASVQEVFWCQQRSSRESPDPASEGYILSIVPSLAQWEQGAAEEGDLIGKGYVGTSPHLEQNV